MKRGLIASAKSIDPGQATQSAQPDLGRNFLLLINFLHIHGPVYLMIESVVVQNEFLDL